MRTKFLMAICVVGLVLSSCGNGELTKGQAESALKEGKVMFQDNSQVVAINTGYFQLDDAKQRMVIRQLANAGVLTYSVDKVMRTVQKGWGRSAYEVQEPHYFVNVELTKEGKKLVVAEPVELADKDMESKIKEKYSLDVPHSEIEDGPPVAKKDDDAAPAREASSNETYDENDKNIEYKKAKARSYTEHHNVLTHRIKLVKVKNIACAENDLKSGQASCTYIYENTKVTPFGYFMRGIEEGERSSGQARFVKYVDSGWKLAN